MEMLKKSVVLLILFVMVNGVSLRINGATQLHGAVQLGDLKQVKLLLESDVDINATTEDGSTALHLAAARSDGLDLVKLLVEKGANVNAKNIYGYRPMDYAAQQHNIEIAKVLAEANKNKKLSPKTTSTSSGLAGKDLHDVFQIRNEVDPSGTITNVVFACRLDFLSKLMNIHKPPTSEVLVNYRNALKQIVINRQSVGVAVNVANGDPCIELIYSPDGTIPTNEYWGRQASLKDPVIKGDGSGLMSGQRGRFDDGQDYVAGGLSADEDAQSKLFIVPSLTGTGAVTQGATSIRQAIEVALHQSPLAKFSNRLKK